MKLQEADRQGSAGSVDNFRRFVDEEADDIDKRRNPSDQFCRPLRRDIAWTGRIEDEADRVSPRRHRGIDILVAGQAANLDPCFHFSIPSRKSSSGLGNPQCGS